MDIRMHATDSARASQYLGRCELAFVGIPLDDRCRKAVEVANACANKCMIVVYDPKTLSMLVDDKTQQCDELQPLLKPASGKVVLFDATTMGFVELILCSRAARDVGVSQVIFQYVEPQSYAVRPRATVVHRRDFELTEEIDGFRGIPGVTFKLDENKDQSAIFFLGFEGQRFAQALELLPVDPRNCSAVFGVPAFQAGWEMDAFANNVGVLIEGEVGGGVSYCPADNPRAVFEYLESRYGHKEAQEQLFVAPIGSKPHGIGAILFSCAHDDVGILYDHPHKRTDRSSDHGPWHYYHVAFK